MTAIPIISTGAICSAGVSVEASFSAIAEGKNCLTPLTRFDHGLKQDPLCGQVTVEPDTISGVETANRSLGLAMAAATEALAVVSNIADLRLGVICATTVAGMTRSELFYKELLSNPEAIKKAYKELLSHEPGSITGFIAAKTKAQGFHTLSTACSTGLHAIGMAKQLIENNTYDLCLAVGTDALSLLTVRGFASLMLIDFSGCKPFDANRVGISLGEGAGALLLGSPKACKSLGIKPLAQISGWGASADCHHMTAPHPEGDGAKRAAEAALFQAEIDPKAITMIATHGTATPDNDSAEIKAMESIFKQLPPFCSMKGTLGHTLAASGTLESVFAISALLQNRIPATAGFSAQDDSIGYTPAQPSTVKHRHILKNSFGFGGNNASIVISATEHAHE